MRARASHWYQLCPNARKHCGSRVPATPALRSRGTTGAPRFEVAAVSIKRIADTRAWPRGPPLPTTAWRLLGLPRAMLVGSFGALRGGLAWLLAGGQTPARKPPFGGGVQGDPLNVARDRQNQAIAAMLVPRSPPPSSASSALSAGRSAGHGGRPVPFAVTCYHMPCMFRTVADRQVGRA